MIYTPTTGQSKEQPQIESNIQVKQTYHLKERTSLTMVEHQTTLDILVNRKVVSIEGEVLSKILRNQKMRRIHGGDHGIGGLQRANDNVNRGEKDG